MFSDSRIPNREITPEAVDAALRAFWAGSAGPLDRLFEGPDEPEIRIGEILLEVCEQLTHQASRDLGAENGRVSLRGPIWIDPTIRGRSRFFFGLD